MDEIEKKVHLSLLFDFYQELLTDKQKTYFKYYYFDDYSLSEIADILDVSRAAVFDQIKIVSNNLEEYEKKLGLKAKFDKEQDAYKKIKSLTDNKEILKIINSLEEN